MKQTLSVVHDECTGFWTGKPWLVVGDDSEPALAAFKHDDEAFGFIEDYEEENRDS